MNIVTILLKNNPQILQFHYDKYIDAVKAVKLSSPCSDILHIEDDYGSQANIDSSVVAAVSVTDLSREFSAQEIVECEKLRKDMRVNNRMNAEQRQSIVTPPGRMQS